MKRLLAPLLILAAAACATKDAQTRKAVNLSKGHFSDTATVKDDYLDTIATITTVNGLTQKHGLMSMVWDDNFLRAFIDKRTGETSFQLYQVIYYTGGGWNFYQTANYETPSGPQSKPATVIHRDVDCSGSRYSGCTYVEHVAFDVEQSVLRAVAADYMAGRRAGWGFKFSARSGGSYNERMLSAEIAGLLDAVDAYLRRKGLARNSTT